MPTFAHRFRRNLPNKFEEWICSSVILGIGIIWLIFPEGLRTARYEGLPRNHGARTVDGHLRARRSPPGGGHIVQWRVRACWRAHEVVGALVGCTIFGAFFGRAMASSEGLLTLGTVLYTGYFVMDIRNAVRSAADGFNGWRKVSYVTPVVR